jgi:predicted DNA-binding transcriptional regulator AlpA
MPPDDDLFLDIKACCERVGGSRPIHKASWYRHVRSGAMPRPVKVGALSRWLRSEVEASLQRMIEGRAR